MVNSTAKSALSSDKLLTQTPLLSTATRLVVGYSGGVDSHALLHYLAAHRAQLPPLLAVHIQHGLHPDSPQWSLHCEAVCGALNIDFVSIPVQLEDIAAQGLEAAARTARYAAFSTLLAAGDMLLTAQHQQDQAETVLLQLLRGGGVKGLAAMPTAMPLGAGTLCRPLLLLSQSDIMVYAKQHKLTWIEDPSNADSRWDRNYLRQQVMPLLQNRWPAMGDTLSRSAAHCAEASDLLATLAAQDMTVMGCDKASETLPIADLLALPLSQCKNVLRHWFMWRSLPTPSAVQLEQIIETVCGAQADAIPLLAWAGVEVRRYQANLYAMRSLAKHDTAQQIKLGAPAAVILIDHQKLLWKQAAGSGLKQTVFTQPITVRYRRGGEKIQLANRPHHTRLKHAMQDWKILPWLRDRTPLLYQNDMLIAVVGYAVAEGYAASAQEQGWLPMVARRNQHDK